MSDPRAPIFAAIKGARGNKPYTVADVASVHAFLDTLRVPKESGMVPSNAIVLFVRNTEGLARKRSDGRVEAYLPTPDDVPTIGYGSTGPDIALGTIWTVAQCEARFAAQLQEFASGVLTALDGAPVTQGQFDAMVSLAYNIGIGALRNSTLLKLHKAGDYASAAAQFARWNKQAGKVLNGLTIRRAAEAEFYRS